MYIVFADAVCPKKPFFVLVAGKLKLALRFRKALERDDDVLNSEGCRLFPFVCIVKAINF